MTTTDPPQTAATNTAARPAGACFPADPAPLRVVATRNHPIKLGTADEIRLEMARVYRAMKAGRIESQQGTRLVYVLGELRKALETTLIERRLTALEATVPAVALPVAAVPAVATDAPGVDEEADDVAGAAVQA